MRRLTVDEVVEAYALTKTVPCAKVYFREDQNSCCAMGAVMLASDPAKLEAFRRREPFQWNSIDDLGITSEYRDGFMRGFDGREPGGVSKNSEEFKIGFEDGTKAWQAVTSA